MTPSERDFFRQVSLAAFTNPFGEDRARLDTSIAGVKKVNRKDNVIDVVIANVAERVEKLAAEGKAAVGFYSGAEREIMGTVFLFDTFHRYLDNFDSLILEQIRMGDNPCVVPFAGDALAELARRGFGSDDSLRFFAFFYQLRRAFYFINSGLMGRSPSMKTLRMHLWNSIFTCNMKLYDQYLWNRMEDFSTLLLGETGTGKGAAAAAIGRSGFIPFDVKKARFTESFTLNFISLNLSQHPEALIESELFGHKKGAFTGATDHHEGVFKQCAPHGAIFLDEIGDVSLHVQIKLLQILQARTFSPVGSHEKLRFNGRVISATNRPLNELRQTGKFRDDFFYRLCSDIITVPTLRQRVGEDPLELEALLSRLIIRLTGKQDEELARTVNKTLKKDLGINYPWPGNVRELEQATRRVLLTGSYKGDEGSAAPGMRDKLVMGIDAGALDADTLLSAYCRLLYDRFSTYEEVAGKTGLDRRTVKKYVLGYKD